MTRIVRLAAVLALGVCTAAAVLTLPKTAQYVRAEDRNGDGRPDEWRRYDQAIEQYEKALALEPANAIAHGFLCLAYLSKSLYKPAIGAAQKSVQLSQGASSFVALVGEAYAAAGCREEAHKVLEQLQEVSKHQYVTPYLVARIYSALGDKDEAFRWLEVGYREHEALMVTLKTDPRMDELRSDRRFQNLMGRMNFPA